MKLTYDNITDRHKGETCVMSLHGPSLSPYIDKTLIYKGFFYPFYACNYIKNSVYYKNK